MYRDLFPSCSLPEGLTEEDFLQQLCEKGVVRRYGEQIRRHGKQMSRTLVQERLQFELDHLKRGGFAKDVILNWDIINYAKGHGIPVGPGRYWQPSSLVAYVLGITDIDPLEHGLICEMHFNPERFIPPSVEVDVAYNHRDELIQYLREKYGEHSVSPICFSDWPHNTPPIPDLASPSSVVISVGRLADIVPMTVDKHGHSMTQYARCELEKFGCLVVDLHPQNNLAVNQAAIKLIRETKGADISLNNLPSDDPETYRMLTHGQILGVFPVDSLLAADACRAIKPSRMADIAALVAFHHVDLDDLISLYAARKHGTSPVTYKHPLLEPVLREAYGIMLYREQYVQAVELLAGYTRGRADLMRRTNLRGDPSSVAPHLPVFVEGCANQNNIPADEAGHLFDGMNQVAKHLFSKSYAVSSSLLSYQTAYLKAHYPSEFYSALLEHHCDDPAYLLRIWEEMTSYGMK